MARGHFADLRIAAPIDGMSCAPGNTGAGRRPASGMQSGKTARKAGRSQDPLSAHKRQLRLIAAQIRKLSGRMRELYGQIPLPDDFKAREEHCAPYTVEMDLRAAVEGAISDHLEPAADALLAAVEVTNALLESQFYEGKVG
jgi:hypothetical protein